MLVLSRRAGESIQIAVDIEVKVLAIRGNVVRLGFSAPPSIPIHRSEIVTRIRDGCDTVRPVNMEFADPHRTPDRPR